MKPLIVLVGSFIVTFLTIFIFLHQFEGALAGRIAMSAMLVFTAMGHFIYTRGMILMIPDAIPFKRGLVYITGIFEFAAAIALQLTAFRQSAGWLLILFFVLMLPANINAAIKHIDYQKGTADGKGQGYLWFRVPLQIAFILWTYYSSIGSPW